MHAVPNEKRPTSIGFLHQADRYKNLPRFQGARPDHVQVQSSRCCFLGASLSFVRPRASLSFDQWHVTRSPPIRKHIWVGRYNNTFWRRRVRCAVRKHKDSSRYSERSVKVLTHGCAVCTSVVFLTLIFVQNKLVKFTSPFPGRQKSTQSLKIAG